MMNKFVIFLLASAVNAVPDPCATAHELNNGDGKTEYYLKYRVMSDDDYNKEPAEVFVGKNGISFGYKNTGKNAEDIVSCDDSIDAMKVKVVKYDPQKGGEKPGFRVLTSDNNRVLSWNQAKVPGHGYFLYKNDDKAYVQNLHDPQYTKFAFKDEDKSLTAFIKSKVSAWTGDVNHFDSKVLGYRQHNTKRPGYLHKTSIYGVQNKGQKGTRFCFEKVTKLVDETKHQDIKKMIEADTNKNNQYSTLEESEKEDLLNHMVKVDDEMNPDTIKTKIQQYFQDKMENKILTHAKGENVKKLQSDNKPLQKIAKSLMKQKNWTTITENDVEAALKEHYEEEEIISNKKQKETQKKNPKPEESAVAQSGIVIALVCLLAMN